MHWNHRVVKHDGMYYIEEVYYDKNGNPDWHTNSEPVVAEDVEGLRWLLESMLKCLKQPVLEENNFSNNFFDRIQEEIKNAPELSIDDLVTGQEPNDDG